MQNPAQSSLELLVEELALATLDWISPESRQLIAMIATAGGKPGSPTQVAHALGFRNRHQLTRLLVRERLPSLEALAGWIRILLWLAAWERERTPLARAALHAGHDPAVRFRTVRDIVGCTWTELQERGLVWAVLELRRRCMRVEAVERLA